MIDFTGLAPGPRESRGPVLVTGAGGLLGSALVRALAQDEDAELLTPSRDELDLRDGEAVDEYFQKHQPEVVFHLAAFVKGLGGNLAAGAHAFEFNAVINANVLTACMRFPPQTVFAAGTVAMYGYPYARVPLLEEDVFKSEPHEGEYYYAVGKRAMLPYLQVLRRAHGTRIGLGLFTNMYGPGDRFDDDGAHVVPSLVRRFVNAQEQGLDEVVVWGRPDTTRDFLYVDDAVHAMLAMTRAGADVCNLASGREATMRELVEELQAATGFDGRIAWASDMPIGIPKRSVDVSRLLSIDPAFAPRSLAEGVGSTVAWYRQSRVS